MQYYNNILAVESSWLVDSGIITFGNYINLRKRKQIHVLRRGCNATPALVEYESLPDRFKVKVKEVLGCDPYETVVVNRLGTYIYDDNEISKYYDSYQTADGVALPLEKRREYYANALIFEAIKRFSNEQRSKSAAIGGRKRRVITYAFECVKSLDRSRYPFNLPSNLRAFERKYCDYCKNGYESLIHNAYKNGEKNSRKVTEQGLEVLKTIFAHQNNLNNEQVAMLYGEFAKVQGWKPLSASAVAVWRDKLDALTYAGRRGVRAYKNDIAMQVRRSLPTFPLAMWSLDGWDVELFYQSTRGGRTTYGHRVTMVVVLDPYFDYPIGYAIGEEGEAENAGLITRAIQNALRHTEELWGAMYQVNQIQSDNFAKKKMMSIYEVAGAHVTPAEIGNAKSKRVERYFKHLNQRYCQLCSNWSGWGVTASKDIQPNGEALNRTKRIEPDFAGVCRQIDGIINHERESKRDLYVGGFSKIPAERVLPLSRQQYLMAFGSTTGNRNLMRGEGLTIAIEGRKHVYDCFDLNFRKYSSTRWEIRYDVEDLSTVVATNEDETLQFVMEEKYVQPMALVERTEEDTIQLQRIRNFNALQEAEFTKQICAAQETTLTLMEAKKELEKHQQFLLTDAQGQHKNNRNRFRKAIEGETVAEIVNNDSIYDNY